MKIGIPKGLLYVKYNRFATTFLTEMGAEIVASPDTNKQILDAGVKSCVDEACLPMKVFHGHVSYLKDRCDMLFVPRLMGVAEKEFICPMFCGLPEMLNNNIPNLPPLLSFPLYSLKSDSLSLWAQKTGKAVTKDKELIQTAFEKALARQKESKVGVHDTKYPLTVALIGHMYNVNDPFINMDLIKKLNDEGVGVITEEYADEGCRAAEVARLFKKPFWTFAKNYYGAAVSLKNKEKIDGMIYLSSFSCGIDSVIIELIKHEIGDFPFMVVKLDEHTGEAGFLTRIEAFLDMLKRRNRNGHHLPPYGQRLFCG